MILPRIVKDFACPACKGTLLQEGAVYSCTGCGYRATCVEPFPLEAGKTPVLTSIRTTSICLTCRRSLTDHVGCAECGPPQAHGGPP